jgi:hypothetical protein
MTGGLLNLVSYGQESILLFGDPQKTLFKAVYKRISNFGMQKFRIDYEGSRDLRMTTETKMDFKIPRYADLLYDSYIVVNMPDIWSPLYPDASGNYIEYGFKWIEELGSNMVKRVEVSAGGQLLGRYTGEYFANVVQRDRCKSKIELWNRMTGNVAELNDPGNAFSRTNTYPNAYYTGTTNIRPSIKGRKLFIPIDAWFGLSSGMAFPLISLQYNELTISVTFRSIKELYTIRDVEDVTNDYPYIAPSINNDLHQFYHFVNPPEDASGNVSTTNEQWNTDIHLISTYIFLSKPERIQFAKKPQSYLVKYVYDREFLNTTGSKTVELESQGLIASYMMRFRRSDAFMRNTWSNYTNWPYDGLPFEIENTTSPDPLLYVTGNFTSTNEILNNKDVLINMALVLDGKYRENALDQGVYNYIEKYNNTKGGAKDGLYIYSFALNTDLRSIQPSGAMNMDKFENIELQINTIEPPPTGPDAEFTLLCDPSGNVIGTRKNLWQLNAYNFDLMVFEERYNVVHFESGMVGLKYAI